MRQNLGPLLDTKLVPADARAHNRALVLHTIVRAESASRADVARITGLSRITVSDLVSDLVDDEIVIETGVRGSHGRPGKPARLLQLNPDVLALISVDLSERHCFRAHLLSADGTVRQTAAAEGDFRGEAAIAAIMNLVARLADAAEAPLGGIGIGAPGIVDDHGTVIESTNLDWHDVPLADALRDRFKAPVLVENDGNAAISAELDFANPPDTFLVRIGVGVGGAAVINGRVVHGANSAVGEFGQMRIEDAADGNTTVEHAVRGLVENITALRQVGPEAASGIAAAHVKIGRLLGHALASAVAMLDVDQIILQGPRHLDLDAIAATLHSAVARQRTLPFGRSCEVRPGSQGADAVLHGISDMLQHQALVTL